MRYSERIDRWLPVFFGIAACSWVPHWSCHYYRIETDSAFVVGGLEFSKADSTVAMLVYSVFIGLNLYSISVQRFRFGAALVSGIAHLIIAALHGVRLFYPFTFQVFGYNWPLQASLREVMIVLPFGILCLLISVINQRQNLSAEHANEN